MSNCKECGAPLLGQKFALWCDTCMSKKVPKRKTVLMGNRNEKYINFIGVVILLCGSVYLAFLPLTVNMIRAQIFMGILFGLCNIITILASATVILQKIKLFSIIEEQKLWKLLVFMLLIILVLGVTAISIGVSWDTLEKLTRPIRWQ